MAKNQDPGRQEPNGPQFPEGFVQAQGPMKSLRHLYRPAEGVKIANTGRIILNRAGSDMVLDLLQELGMELARAGIVWAADEKARELAGRVVGPSTPMVTPIREDSTRKTLTLYPNQLFLENTWLRTYTKSSATISRRPGPDGQDMLVIHLGISLPKNTGTRSDSGNSKSAQAKQSTAKTTDAKAAPEAKKAENA